MSQRHAVVVGAGVGGLAAAAGLEQHGWDVSVLERGGNLTGGAGISLWPNGLAALAELGVQDRVLAGAVLGGRSGVRTPGGKWIARSDIADAVRSRYGRPLVLTRRETLLQALAGRLASGPILFGVTAVDVKTAGQRVSVQTDGESLTPSDVIRTDIVEIAEPLTTLHCGRGLLLGDAAHAMTPDLGQGGCQSLEDAATRAALVGAATSIDDALRQYSAQRARRGADLVRRSRRSGRLYQAPPLVARTVARLASHLPATALVRPLAPVLDWRPPAPVPGTSGSTRSTPHDHPLKSKKEADAMTVVPEQTDSRP